jgi:uncharacterized protein DUF6912
VRVYLPATVPLLRRWLTDGQAPAGLGWAVTPGLREWYREGDEEEMEYVAQLAAGRSSLGLLADDRGAPRRRVVVAAEAPDPDVMPTGGARGQVTVGVPVPCARWASALVDGPDAEQAVAVAVDALPAASAGDDDAAFALDEVAAAELGWYALQELPDLLREL